MADRPALSKGEMEVARVLWEIGPAAVREIHEAISQVREIDFATVQTYLRRIEKKGYATSVLDGRVRVYAAKAKPRTVIRDTVDDLVNRLFGGDSMPLVRHLIEDRGIDANGLAELRELVDRLEQPASSQKSSSKPKKQGRKENQRVRHISSFFSATPRLSRLCVNFSVFQTV